VMGLFELTSHVIFSGQTVKKEEQTVKKEEGEHPVSIKAKRTKVEIEEARQLKIKKKEEEEQSRWRWFGHAHTHNQTQTTGGKLRAASVPFSIVSSSFHYLAFCQVGGREV